VGERLGTTPLGFRTPGPGQAMEPVPEEQRVIRQILRMWRRGRSYRQIADTLNRKGTSTKRGARWHHSTVGNIVRARVP
jgi:recombinase